MALPTLLEVKKAIDSILTGATARPDGFSSVFFVSCWDTVGRDIQNAIIHLCQGGNIPRFVTTSLICLILKKQSPKKLSDYRPISLCNCLYKILANIVATRLSDILPSIMSMEQGSFILGRLISENIALSQKLFRDISKKVRGGNIILKLDMEKAGLGQGDPLSPALFIIVVEALSRGLKSLLDQGQCIPFKTRRGYPRVSHLLYADDTHLFLNGGLASLRVIRDFLDIYQASLGQSINLSKSYFVCADKMLASRVRVIEEVLGISRSSSTFTYLGVPILAGRVKSSAAFFGCGSATFFWGWSQGKRKLHWMNWKRMVVPLEEGGLGFKRLHEVMQAFHLKMAWSILFEKTDSLWGNYMAAKYNLFLHPDRTNRRCSFTSPLWIRIQAQLSLMTPLV
ncbi:uncharacterized protein LOC131254230 [Magnolia sinica]|uniref:uncharacterized protein LOC131254230 n=1 Tax=Magnolia sinica TaxID=86752 RepID=UPI0026581BD5|nr:uncharacterized protein LOC131254230 [Magnolia sinica]